MQRLFGQCFGSSARTSKSPAETKDITLPLKPYTSLTEEEKTKAATAYNTCRTQNNSLKVLEQIELKPLPLPPKSYASLSIDEKKEIQSDYHELPIHDLKAYDKYIILYAEDKDYPLAQKVLACSLARKAASARYRSHHTREKILALAARAAQWACRSVEHPTSAYESLPGREYLILGYTAQSVYGELLNEVKFYHPIVNRLAYSFTIWMNEMLRQRYDTSVFEHPSQEKFAQQRKDNLNRDAKAGASSLLEYILELTKNPDSFTPKMDALLKDVSPENKFALLGHFEIKATDQKLSPFTIFSSDVVPIKPPYDAIIRYLKTVTATPTPTSSSSSSSHTTSLAMVR